MNICKKCKRLINSIDYPDQIGSYELCIKSEIFSVYRCLECKTYIMNGHKRYGYQTEYLPYNKIIDEKEYENLKILKTN